MAVRLPRPTKRAPTSSKCKVSLSERLRGTRDLLVPHFAFCRLLHGNRESLMLRQVHALRDAAQAPDSLPGSDAADAWGVHALAWDRQQRLAAAVRLVQPPAGHAFPFQHAFPDVDPATLAPHAQAAEVSAPVVHARYRRRVADSLHGIARDFAEHGELRAILPAFGGARQRSHGPLLLLGLYRELLRHSREQGIAYWYAVLERPLARSLDQMGFPFRPVEPEAAAGEASLHLLDLAQLGARLGQQNRFLAAWLQDQPVSGWVKLRLLLQALR